MSPIKIKTLLVGVDAGSASDAAISYAMSLAEGLLARVHLVHAFELPIVGLPDGAIVPSADEAAKIVEDAQGMLDRAVARCRRREVEVTSSLEQGSARAVILDAAKEIGADLIVLGTHGRRGIARALVGSVAESVVRTSPIPVLTVHGPTEP